MYSLDILSHSTVENGGNVHRTSVTRTESCRSWRTWAAKHKLIWAYILYILYILWWSLRWKPSIIGDIQFQSISPPFEQHSTRNCAIPTLWSTSLGKPNRFLLNPRQPQRSAPHGRLKHAFYTSGEKPGETYLNAPEMRSSFFFPDSSDRMENFRWQMENRN
jgi:hypothetical protein